MSNLSADTAKIVNKIIQNKGFNNCLVVFQDESYMKINLDLIFKYGLNKDKAVEIEQLKLIENEQNIIDAKQTAYNYAAYKPRTENQVITKLHEKNFPDEVIERSVQFLKQFNLIDDEKFAATFINSVLVRKNTGINKAKIELMKRGIKRNDADYFIEKYYPKNLTNELAMKAAEKKVKIYEKYPIVKRKQMMMGHLMRSGFSIDDAKSVIIKLYHED